MDLSGLREEVPRSVVALAERCNYEEEHTWQVTRIAAALFDELSELHGMGERERRILISGAALHDIGWCKGGKGHHKSSYKIASESLLDGISASELEMAAQVGRYHRKAPPSIEHAPFARLSTADQKTVTMLSAILRVADGLDRGHRSVVKALSCEISADKVTVHLECYDNAELEVWGATRKADLFEQIFQRRLVLTVQC